MIKSKLIRLYSTLTKAELKQFNLWLNSPIFNQHKDSIKLFKFLKTRQKITRVTVQKKRAFEFVYPNTVYKDEKLRSLMNHCLSLLKKFVGYNALVLENFEQQKKTIQSLKERNLLDLATTELDKLAHTLNQQENRNESNSLQHFEVECERFELKGTQDRLIQTNLPNIFNHLTDFFILSILKYACVASSHSNITRQNYSIPLLQEILREATKSKHPIVLLYYNAYQTLNNIECTAHTYFKQLEVLFLKHYQKLLLKEQNDILLVLINYCIKKRLSVDADSFIKKGFEWYRWGLQHAVLFPNGTLSRLAYLNIVSMGLQLKEFEWVENFIIQYAQYLPLQFQENYQHYATAKSSFKQKNYLKAQRLLTQIEYDDIFLNLDSKTMLLEIYYEEKSWDSLELLLVSFNRYLQRKQVIAYHKKVYKKIILLTQKLMSIKPYDKAAKASLLEEITTTTPLAERDWLLEQAKLL